MKHNAVFEIVEGRFYIFAWVIAAWLCITWVTPLLFLQAIDMTWEMRHGLFLSMRHMLNFHNTTDGLYIFIITYVVVMLLAGLGFSIYYFYYKVQYHKKNTRMRVGVWRSTAMRVCVVIFCFVYGILVSVAAVAHVACTDIKYMREHALAIKYPSYKNGDFGMARKYARMVYGQAYSSDSADGMSTVGGHLLSDHYFVVINHNMSLVQMFSNETVSAWARNGNLYFNGSRMVPAFVGGYMKTDTLYVYERNGGNHMLNHPEYPTESRPVNTHYIDYELARDGVTRYDISRTSAVEFVLGAEGIEVPSEAQMVSLMGDPNFQFGLSYASLMVMMHSVKHRSHVDLQVNRMDIESVLYRVKSCHGIVDYAEGLFVVTFFVAFICAVLYFVIMQVMAARERRGYKKLDKSVTEGLLEGNSFEEDDDDGTEWNKITSHSNKPGAVGGMPVTDLGKVAGDVIGKVLQSQGGSLPTLVK